jgi:methylated-DNA-[protein]-cysteine S-methyltransferase
LKNKIYFTEFGSPVGTLQLRGNGTAVTGVFLENHPLKNILPTEAVRDEGPLRVARQELEEYFEGTRQIFSLPLEASGTPFQKSIWAALGTVPYGEVISYGTLALRMGRPRAARAVGLANARNPLSIVVPCHRVVGSKGALTGYSGGLESKRFLLALEAANAGLSRRT